MARTDPLLEPFQLKHLRLKNRIISTSHAAPGYTEGGLPKERYQLYMEERAKGGMSLFIFGGSSLVAPDSSPIYDQIYVGDDRVISYFKQLAERMLPYGTAVMCQITHMGRRGTWNNGHWLPTISSSCVPEPAHRTSPKEMEVEDIKRVVKSYGDAARRCLQGGLDGIEVLISAHLPGTFLSPLVNRRTDQYGGSLENRMRFTIEVLEQIRKEVGHEFIVGIRSTFDEIKEGGLSFQECIKIANHLSAAGLVDFLNVNKGNSDTVVNMLEAIPLMGTPSAPQLKFAGSVKAEVDLPVFHAAKIADTATARYAIKEGLVDMVGMTRAHMADPYLVRKIEQGEEDQIRPCVGAGYCMDHTAEMLCIHNAATGREQTMPHLIKKAKDKPRKIVVVGGGPAGLEAARVCAERGHRVLLFEGNRVLGGQVQMACRIERRKDLIGIIDWRGQQIAKLGVDVNLNCYAGVDEVLSENPNVVIIATGGIPQPIPLDEGAELVVSSWDILTGQVAPCLNALIYDDHGQHQGLTCAEFMAGKGSKLGLVTPENYVGKSAGYASLPGYYEVLYNRGVTMIPNHRLRAVRRQEDELVTVFRNEYNNSIMERHTDQVVVEYGTLPADNLYFDLKDDSSNLGELDLEALISGRPQVKVSNPAGTYQLFRVGDAVSGRNIHAAIYDSLRLCKEL
jgi:2,4-dienoyl-CoA reductase-like NADH-dependent reductase (Old Yellow Enzyme family)